jgi:hypothetical protein
MKTLALFIYAFSSKQCGFQTRERRALRAPGIDMPVVCEGLAWSITDSIEPCAHWVTQS